MLTRIPYSPIDGNRESIAHSLEEQHEAGKIGRFPSHAGCAAGTMLQTQTHVAIWLDGGKPA